MRSLIPPSDPVDPFEAYAGDERPPWPDRPWLLLNMITSVDGGTHLDGRSGPLGGPGDKQVFRALRAIADVILVAAGTVRSEQYHPVVVAPEQQARRMARGQTAKPRLAIITRHLDLDLDGELITGGEPPILLTTDAAPDGRLRHAMARTDVVRFPGARVDVAAAVRSLSSFGAKVVLCEGGPTLNGQLVYADVLDELCLTISPMMVGGDATRLVDPSSPFARRDLRLDRLIEEDGFLFLRYLRRH
jgi:riboflavin biosynthesis pyrimidine reductase